MDRIRITIAGFLFSSGIRRHPRIPQQTQSSGAHTDAKMGSRYLAAKKMKTKRSQLLIKLDALQRQWQWSLELWQPQTNATVSVIAWKLGRLSIHAAQKYIAQAMRKKANCMCRRSGFSEEASSEFSENSGGSIQNTNIALLQAAILT